MFGNKMNAVEKAVRKNHIPALIELSKSKDKAVSLAAIAGLGAAGGDDAAHYLTTRLQSPETDVRIAVAKALGTLANKHHQGVSVRAVKKGNGRKGQGSHPGRDGTH